MKIKIIGRPKRGKTTVAQIIQEALHHHGISTTIEGEDSTPEYLASPLEPRVDTLMNRGLHVTLEMVQAGREEKS